jgi:general nucleoside transport system ATP-binding protein
VVGTTTPGETTMEELATMMVGRQVQLTVDKEPAKPAAAVLEISDLVVRDERGHAAVDHLNLTVHAGEILAVAGVQGNGQSELAEAITGLRPIDSGQILLEGAPMPSDPRAAYAAGVAHVPEDRMEDGLVEGFNIAENLVLTGYWQPPYARGLRLERELMATDAATRITEYDIRTPSVFNDIGNLSGGNQQKVIVAREFTRPVKLLVAVQPTRGLDVGSIEYIHARIVEKRDEGAAVLIIATELDEVVALGDRIAVMYQGKIVGILSPEEASFERLGLLMGGAHPEDHSAEELVEAYATAAEAETDD